MIIRSLWVKTCEISTRLALIWRSGSFYYSHTFRASLQVNSRASVVLLAVAWF